METKKSPENAALDQAAVTGTQAADMPEKTAEVQTIKCKFCGKETDANDAVNGICPECLQKGDTCTCSKCGKEYIFTNFEKYVKKDRNSGKCPECLAKDHETKIELTCVHCGKKYTLSQTQVDFYQKHHWNLPKRCKECREANRKLKWAGLIAVLVIWILYVYLK